MGQFDQTIDDDEGVILAPDPSLDPTSPEDPGLPPAMLGSAPPVARPPVPMPTPPQAPNGKQGTVQQIIQMALMGLAAGMGPRKGLGVARGIQQGAHEGDVLRQREFQNQQQVYQQQQLDAYRQQQLQDVQERAEQAQYEKRRERLAVNVANINKQIKALPNKAAYDRFFTFSVNSLRRDGYPVNETWLRQATEPYVAPGQKERARAVITDLFKSPIFQQQIKNNPNAWQAGSIMVDLDDDGNIEKRTVQEVMNAGVISLLLDDTGKPVSFSQGDDTDGPIVNLALKAAIARYREVNRLAPDKSIPPAAMEKLIEEARKTPKDPSAAGGGADSDVKEIVAGIVDGTQPPDMGRMYGKTAAIRAELHRQGYDLTKATQDWQAVQKFTATANGAQQTRMRQAVDNAYHSLDVIDQLAEEWKGGRFPPLNKGRLMAAKNGALGPEAQRIATQLDAQISDVTSELGNVYMGGNSPTDHALSLAAKNLSADWSMGQLKSMVEQSRVNLKIRQNSMRNVGPVSQGGGTNNYAAPTAPSGEEAWERDPATGKLRKKGT